MKTAKEIKVENRTHTQLTCTSCGAVTHVKAAIGTKTARDALGRRCGSCEPHNYLAGCGWWTAFGLDSNCYVYGPMPRLRTGRDYRMQEARRRGWMAWVWNDEYREQRLM